MSDMRSEALEQGSLRICHSKFTCPWCGQEEPAAEAEQGVRVTRFTAFCTACARDVGPEWEVRSRGVEAGLSAGVHAPLAGEAEGEG